MIEYEEIEGEITEDEIAGDITDVDISGALVEETLTGDIAQDNVEGSIGEDDLTGEVEGIPFMNETDPTVPAWAKEPTKPSYDFSEIQNTPVCPVVPTRLGAFQNDVGFITIASLTGYALESWVADNYISATELSTLLQSYAMKSWVQSQGYLTSHQSLADYYRKSEVDSLIADEEDAIKVWVENKKYLQHHQSLDDYATKDWVGQQGYIKNHQSLSNYYNKSEVNTLLADKADDADLATVAKSGSYNDLTDKPVVPLGDFYTKQETDALLLDKLDADVIDDYYDKTATDALLDDKLDSDALDDYYDKNAVDGLLDNKANTADLATVATSGDYTDLANKPTLFSGDYNDLTNKPTIPTVPTNVSAFTNDAGYLVSSDISALENNVATNTNDIYQLGLDVQDLDDTKYDKTGGEISGNVQVTGNVEIENLLDLKIPNEDYDAGIKFQKSLDLNRGTVLTLVGYADGEEHTAYKVPITNVGTPVADWDAVNKRYVDDKLNITWITGFYDDGQLIVGSSAYEDCFNGITTNHTVYLKVTDPTGVSVMRLQSWLHYNDHSTHGDSFQFTGLTDADTTKMAFIGYNTATYYTADLEQANNKITAWSATPSDVLYPCESLVKNTTDALDSAITALRAYVDDTYGEHVIWDVPLANGLKAKDVKARNSSGNWSLENLDLTGYEYALAYVQACSGSNADQECFSAVVRINLDEKSISPRSNCYIGSVLGFGANDNGTKHGFVFTIDSTKTKLCYNYNDTNTTGTTALSRDSRFYRLTAVKGKYLT